MSVKFLSEGKEKVLALHGKSQENLDEDLEILKEWIRKQPHLPQSLLNDVAFLEISLIRNKYSIAKTKTKIENYCTFKSRYRYLLDNVMGAFNPSEEPVFIHMIDKLTDKLERIVIVKIFDEEKYDMARDLGIIALVREITSRFDYSDGEICVYDCTSLSVQALKKFRVNVFADAAKIFFRGHSVKFNQTHVIAKWAGLLLPLVKPFLPEKLKTRLFIHETIDKISEIIPPEYLPKDYGGRQKSLAEIRLDWNEILKNNREILEMAYNTISCEELRTEHVDTEMQGTFRNLSVD